MSKLLSALRRNFGDARFQDETPHFHRGNGAPETCYERLCDRPRLSV